MSKYHRKHHSYKRVGSSILQHKDGTYAFILHFIPDGITAEDFTPELILANSADGEMKGSFATMDEAKAAGTAALNVFRDKLKTKGIVAFRPERA